MSNELDPQDGGGGGGLIASNFVAEDGSILWDRLAAALSGGAVLAVFTGVTNTILAIFEGVTGFYSAFGGFLAALVNVLVGTPGYALAESYDQLAAYISTMGPLAFVASVASVLVITRITAWAWANGI